MKDMVFNLWVKAQMAKFAAKEKAKEIRNEMLEEDGGAESIIIAIIIIIIVVGLAIIFRDKIAEWIDKLFGKAEDELDKI